MLEGRKPLRTGWTTGTCATAAAQAAFIAIIDGAFPASVAVALPRGERASFEIATTNIGSDFTCAGVIKDAGDDPDVTHGALILAMVRKASAGTGIIFRAGEGVGTVTFPGLPLAIGQPAINPVPRAMIEKTLTEAAAKRGIVANVEVTISIPGGEALARKTMNGRLGIVGGLSILGTTGIVTPYSCSSWIHSIQRGIDVSRAVGVSVVAGSTGATSEAAVQRLYGLAPVSLIEMGDFAGGLLKYVRHHPVPRLILAGGIGKMTKLAFGHLDLNARRSTLEPAMLVTLAREANSNVALREAIARTPSAAAAIELATAEGVDLAAIVAAKAHKVASAVLEGATPLELCVFNRNGMLLARV